MAEKGEGITLVNDFLGAAHVFASAVSEEIEEDLLHDAADGHLTVSQMKLLKLVSLNGALNMGDVAAFLGVSKAAASKTVDKMVLKTLLQRSPAETDRRAIHLSLTESSRRLLTSYNDARERKLKEIFGLFGTAELRHVSELLDCLSARIAIAGNRAQPGKICQQCGIYFRENCLLRTQFGRKCFHLRSRSRRNGSSGYTEPSSPAL